MTLFAESCLKQYSYTILFKWDDVLWTGQRRESLGHLYELCDNSSNNCSTYAESTVSSYDTIIRCVRFEYVRPDTPSRMYASTLIPPPPVRNVRIHNDALPRSLIMYFMDEPIERYYILYDHVLGIEYSSW